MSFRQGAAVFRGVVFVATVAFVAASAEPVEARRRLAEAPAPQVRLRAPLGQRIVERVKLTAARIPGSWVMTTLGAVAAAAFTAVTLQHAPQLVDNAHGLTQWHVLGAGYAGIAAATLGGLFTRTRVLLRRFTASAPGRLMGELEAALARPNNEADVERLGAGAGEAVTVLRKAIKLSEGAGLATVELPALEPGGKPRRISRPAAEKELAALTLVQVRAALGDSAGRGARDQGEIGGLRPAEWKQAIETLETEAVRSGREGKLALKLQELGTELDGQKRVATDSDRKIAAFVKQQPWLFGGRLRAPGKAARKELEPLLDETKSETALHGKRTEAMRGRVGDRLAKDEPVFRQRRDRMGRLAEAAGKTEQVVSLVSEIEDQLDAVVSNRASQATNLTLAMTQTHVPVPHQVSNGNGGTTTEIKFEDHSQLYRSLAASNASSAEAAARAAASGLRKLDTMVNRLKRDGTLTQEQLATLLPETRNLRADHGRTGFVESYFFAPIFGAISAGSDEASAREARNAFKPAARALKRVNETVGERHVEEKTWVEGQIDADLARQIQQVR
ncbi:MAG: hypothetical protein IT371_26005 [Deltaproteobacteria bacterium]|nr:hypothetical protein [Deltaproteobacteria bacterium]